MSKKELSKVSETQVAIPTTLEDWGQSTISGKDIVIPKILCMQGLSDLVSQEKAKMGDFVDSLTEQVIGNYVSAPIQFIPFHMEKLWAVKTKPAGKDAFEFVKFEAVTAANENRNYDETIDGVEFKYEYTLRFYVLLPNDMSLPYIISFKGTSTRAGKILATQMFVKNKAAGKIPAAYTMSLSGVKDKNDKGTFIVMNVTPDRAATAEEVSNAFNWYKAVSGGGVKVHEAEDEAEDEAVQSEMF
jgi:hypothetical protein